MLINYNPDDYESFSEVTVCDHHKKRPEDRSYPGCTCSAVFGQRMKKKEVIADDIEVGDVVTGCRVNKCGVHKITEKHIRLINLSPLSTCCCSEGKEKQSQFTLTHKGSAPERHVYEGAEILNDSLTPYHPIGKWLRAIDYEDDSKEKYRIILEKM